MHGDDSGSHDARPGYIALRQRLQSMLPSLLLQLVWLCFVAGAVVLRRIRVAGFSMDPTLRPGQRLLVNRLAYRSGRLPQRSDLVILRHPDGSGRLATKRVIALAGETVVIRRRHVTVDGQRLVEPYVHRPATYRWGPITVPPGHVVVLGDNRNGSKDSHRWGPVPASLIRGKVVARYWPPGRIPR